MSAIGLVGRDAVLRHVHELLGAGTRTAVFSEMAGAGKTAALGVVAAQVRASGHRVLDLTCHASDQAVPYGALVDLLSIGDDTGGGPDEAARALLDRLRQEGAQGPELDPLRLRLDVLTWLTGLGEAAPVLVVVDDAQWCDESSLSVLAFVSNRLRGTRVSMVVGARGELPPEPLARHPRLRLPPLDDRQARDLLRRASLRLDAVSLPTVVQRAAGNPLALLELGRAAEARTGEALLPSTVEAAFRSRADDLPAATRWVLLLGAACDGDLRTLNRVLDATALVAALAPAERGGLVRVEERRLRFEHPLVSSAVYSGATTSERVRAHETLAAAYTDNPERELWHLSEASVAPDESLARRLTELADGVMRRNAASEAARLMHRAAELSEDPVQAEHRLLQATMLYGTAGKFDWVVEVGGRLRDEATDPVVRAGAGHMMAYALSQTDYSVRAREAIGEVLEPLLAADPVWGWSTLGTFAVQVYRHGDGAEVLGAWLERFEVETDPATASFPSLIPPARVWIRTQVDGVRRDEADLEAVRTDSSPDDVPMDVAATHEMFLGAAACMLDEPAVSARRLVHAADLMKRADASGEMTQTLMCLGEARFQLGDYDGAAEAVREATDLAEARSLVYPVLEAYEIAARVAAIRGDVERARELCERIVEGTRFGESRALQAWVRVSMSWVRFAEGDAQGAWAEAQWLFDADGSPRHVHTSDRMLEHYVTAAVRAGAHDTASLVVDQAVRRLRGSGRQRLRLAHARGLTAGENAEPWFVEATTDPVAPQWPLEHAMAQTHYGAWLRRRHRQAQARVPLQDALATFERLGTAPWAEVARAELRAAGIGREARTTTSWGLLTGQEREVVRLAAAGRTNPEIAAALHLSRKTVSTHLYNAFPKLGVTARSQLRDVVPELG